MPNPSSKVDKNLLFTRIFPRRIPSTSTPNLKKLDNLHGYILFLYDSLNLLPATFIRWSFSKSFLTSSIF